MVRGNPDKLRPVRTKQEASERGRSGGKKSGQARREKADLRRLLEILLETKRGDTTTAEGITAALVDRALSGDVKAFETIRDTIGQKPVEKREDKVEGTVQFTWQK
ncbi:MAG: hypothetical protein E7022_05920 [Desulfovibrio desulfuricans]|nr:hypothetical protein [Desulfovibrio desulfuricans]